MKHAFALFFSLLLMLGPVVSPQAGGASPADDPCSMDAGVRCVRCACCIESGSPVPSPGREAVPAPESTVRWHLVAGLLSVLPTARLDAVPASMAVRNPFPSPQPVPIYRRHCLLLI